MATIRAKIEAGRAIRIGLFVFAQVVASCVLQAQDWLPPVVGPRLTTSPQLNTAPLDSSAQVDLAPIVIASEAADPRVAQGVTLSAQDLRAVRSAPTESMPPKLGQPSIPSYLLGNRLPLDQQVFTPDMSVTQGLRSGPPPWAIGFPGAAATGGSATRINGSAERTRPVDPNYQRVLDLYPDGNDRRLIEQVREVVRDTEIGVDVTDEQWITVRGNGKRITWGGRIDTDWINWAQDREFMGQPNYVEFRRLRLFASGEGYGVYDYQLELGFAPENDASGIARNEFSVEVKDAIIGLRDLPLLGYVVLGHFRVPIGLANTTSSRFIPFLERSLPTRLLPGRELGFTAYNLTASENVTWSYGMFFDDLNDATGEILDDNQGSRIVGRMTWTPFYDELSHRCFVHTGLGYMYTRPRRRNDPDLIAPVFRPVQFSARPEIHRDDPLIDTGILNVQQYHTVNYEFAWANGPFTLQSELTWSGVDRIGGEMDDLFGAYVYGSLFLTGEQRQYNRRFGVFGRVIPYENFWVVPTSHGHRAGWGAWELAARWSHLSFSDVNTEYLNDLTVGMNWYWNPNSRVMLNWIHPFAHNSPLGTSNNAQGDIIALRLQVDF